MDFARPRRPMKPCQTGEGKAAPSADPVFDQWLTHHLGRLYGPVVQEALPEDLLRLLEQRLK